MGVGITEFLYFVRYCLECLEQWLEYLTMDKLQELSHSKCCTWYTIVRTVWDL
jgi:hypothetical protein